MTLPKVFAPDEVRAGICEACAQPGALLRMEEEAQATRNWGLPLLESTAWKSFVSEVRQLWRTSDHVIVRGIPAMAEGASLLVASLSLSDTFKTYRGGRVVKEFRMSPWTPDLSHTTREGHFHTDLNTDPKPPAVTAIQCLAPDPGSPRYGENRVARVADLLAQLEAAKRRDILRFLLDTEVTMVNGRSGASWSGCIVTGHHIRYHPVTLDAAADLDPLINAMNQACRDVSTPFWLDAGDLLFVSNHRALHYRGECSVEFVQFPTEYRARAIYVLHQMDEPR